MRETRLTRQRLARHFGQDFAKYLVLVVASIVIWVYVFGAANAVHSDEIVQIFIEATSFKNDDTRAKISAALLARGDTYIQQIKLVEITSDDGLIDDLVWSSGVYSSDLIVLSEQRFEAIQTRLLPCSQALLQMVVPSGANVEFFLADDGCILGIRIDTLGRIANYLQFAPPSQDFSGKFFLGFVADSTNMGPFNRQSLDSNDQALWAARALLEAYL